MHFTLKVVARYLQDNLDPLIVDLTTRTGDTGQNKTRNLIRVSFPLFFRLDASSSKVMATVAAAPTKAEDSSGTADTPKLSILVEFTYGCCYIR